MKRPLSIRRSPTAYRIGLSISAAFAVPAVLSVLQLYIQSKVEQQGVKWQDLVFAGSDWLLVGIFTPLIYQLGRHFSFSRTRLKVWLIVHSAGAPVSYTHLDVYKRQELRCPPLRRNVST